jgi:hypothetical protein
MTQQQFLFEIAPYKLVKNEQPRPLLRSNIPQTALVAALEKIFLFSIFLDF